MAWSIRLGVVGLVGACSFNPPAGNGDPATIDAPPVIRLDAADGRGACSAVDPVGLIGCYEMEDGVTDGVLLDSGPAHRDATATGLTATMRGASRAAVIGPSSQIRVPATPALDLSTGYTIALWVNPSQIPSVGEVYGLVDHELQYAMLITNSVATGFQNRCVNTNADLPAFTTALPINTWSFLACTWNGTDLCAVRWTSAGDHERNCRKPSVPPSLVGAQGLAIGSLSTAGVAHSQFGGSIDSVQLYNRRLSSKQLCDYLGLGPDCLCTNCGD